ncbi:ABC transporter substrate-binding protein [Shewanella sp. SR44-3]|uniref:substrate-binding periplasmic protein n=1 Tax=Shewanella sp. SR44-3 TaxID=2760936 RepID=UPI0015FD4CE1|nr:transporter substrate-binding domain-containing protein [Shewanella sp. SR44-3]MBB1268903.1 transporter substrate-binding domain-containing protein [Shewanella sp. SR44-3]
MKLNYALIGLMLAFTGSSVNAETVHLSSLDWAPYSGKSLADQGASVVVAKAAFKAMGHELVVDFFPWSRAVKLASESGSKYAGYFPEYLYESSEFTFSASMGQGPLGLVENKSSPITWSQVADLANFKLGVVQDYVNTEELDALIASGSIKPQTVTSDEINVQKVAGGRIDIAVIDANVLSYMLANNNKLASAKEKVQMNTKLLTNKDLYIAFRNDADGKKWQAIYNEGLGKIDINALMSAHLK